MCAEWEGDGGTVTECACVMCSWTLRQCAFVRHHQNRAGIHAYVGCPDGSWSCFWGVAGDRERVWPLFDVLADVKSGAFGLVLAP